MLHDNKNMLSFAEVNKITTEKRIAYRNTLTLKINIKVSSNGKLECAHRRYVGDSLSGR